MTKKKSKGEQTKATVQVKPKAEIKYVDKIDEQIKEVREKGSWKPTEKKVTNVYSANYKLIDDTIEEIKKASRKVSTSDYAANNVYVFLQNALKKVLDAEK